MREILRKVYYSLLNGRIVTLETPPLLKGKLWKMHTLAGRSYWKGYYEPPITKLITELLTKDSVFFDIGANVGYFSLLAATKATAGQVHSFEPDKPTFQFSNSIRQLNDLHNWTANNLGVGERSGTLYYQKGPTTTTGIISDGGGERMDVTSLDDYIQQKAIKKLDLLKIDVEGYGGYVLRGARQTIAQLKPVILMEFHAGSDEYMVFNELVSPDYTVTTIEGHSITDVVGEAPYHVLAVPAHGEVIQAD